MTTIGVTSPGPPSRAQCTVFMSNIDFIITRFIYFIFAISLYFLYFFRDVQELGGGVVFSCGSNSALVVPVRHALYAMLSLLKVQ